jgi:hypothetical protein
MGDGFGTWQQGLTGPTPFGRATLICLVFGHRAAGLSLSAPASVSSRDSAAALAGAGVGAGAAQAVQVRFLPVRLAS